MTGLEDRRPPGDISPAYRESRGTYYRFFSQAGSAMAIADKSGVLVASNDKFNEFILSLSGTTVELNNDTARLGASLDFLPIHDAVRFSNLLSKLANGDEERMDFKTPYHDKLSKVHWFKIHAWKIRLDPRVDLSDRGPFIGFILNDETVETEAEEKLQEDMRIAEKAMEAKSRFLAAMSHEIRTPIQTIIGMTELLETSALTADQAEYARQIQFSAELLLSLVNNILDYSKLEAGRMSLESIPFSPGGLIRETVEMLSPEAAKKGLELILDLPPEGRQMVRGDPYKFRQVLINLVKNAVKFTPRGKITIGALITHKADYRGKTIAVTVEDTGIGIPEEVREKLFTTFMQADSSHTRRFGGTGLGLAISRNLVELMGGSIEMVPREGGGSIFRFTVPLTDAEAALSKAAEQGLSPPPDAAAPLLEAPPDAEAPLLEAPLLEAPLPPGFVVEAASVQTSSPGFGFFPPLALVVEDQEVNQRLFVMFLEKAGIPVICANDGIEALEQAEKTSVDLVFMDIQMPRMNGCEAALELRKRGFTKPLIAITAGVFSGEREQCLRSGFNDVLLKPFKKQDIEAMCRKWTGAEPLGPAKTEPSGGADSGGAAPGSPAVFNGAELLDAFLHNEGAAKNTLAGFISRTGEQLEALPSLVREKNWEEAFRIAHTIKGSARTLSGMELGEAAFILERAYKTADTGAMSGALAGLRGAFERFTRAATDWRIL